jgi:hypothetical protein
MVFLVMGRWEQRAKEKMFEVSILRKSKVGCLEILRMR